ncbi:PEP-utilizing enzyme [Micromonospora sp. b486]|uniref:PEP-utilizing enzyme n=1 Tax=Micromonospora sp. b486 TaxID=3053986 RepID=UPI00259C95F9|nr:PEP-utilizing enzyme [Micromonospora sp. b486]MDM4784399.1 PEP-utilizing enzyme [Micromonospora sp. b486]
MFDSAAAAAADGPVILVRPETNPDDLPGMIAAAGGCSPRAAGKTSHAAVVARAWADLRVRRRALVIDVERGEFTVGEQVVRAGEVISIDGTNGRIWLGEVRCSRRRWPGT